jgi:hypothetical protein
MVARYTPAMFRIASAGATALVLSVAAITQVSCSQHGTIRDASAESAANVVQRLGGPWTLATYQPEVSLEPTMQLLLKDQLGRLVVTFSGTTLSAQGPGVSFTRTFRITEAYGDHFKATVFDSAGVGIDSVCDFSGSTLIANGMTAPWRGRSTFTRMR